jgi:hypothetical protein
MKPEKPSVLESFMEKGIHLLNRDDTKKKLQIFLIDPLLNHVMERVFPYIILTCVLFTLLFIVAMLTFGMMVLQTKSMFFSAVANTAVASAAVAGAATLVSD